jgi:hypothetical protein
MKNLKTFKLETVLKFGCVIGVVGKLFSELDLIEFIAQYSKLKCGRWVKAYYGRANLAILRYLHKICICKMCYI